MSGPGEDVWLNSSTASGAVSIAPSSLCSATCWHCFAISAERWEDYPPPHSLQLACSHLRPPLPPWVRHHCWPLPPAPSPLQLPLTFQSTFKGWMLRDKRNIIIKLTIDQPVNHTLYFLLHGIRVHNLINDSIDTGFHPGHLLQITHGQLIVNGQVSFKISVNFPAAQHDASSLPVCTSSTGFSVGSYSV